MMVLRHIGPPSATVVHPPDDRSEDEERSAAIPMDLSKSSVRNIEVSPVSHHRHLKLSNNNNNNNTNNNHNNNNNNNNNSIFNNNAKSILFGATFPNTPIKPALDFSSSGRLGRLPRISPGTESLWRSEEDTSYSSPDSGLQRDSPGEDEEALLLNSASAHPSPVTNMSVSLKRNSLIPLSLIRERYIHVNPSARENDEDPYSPRASAPRDEDDEDDNEDDEDRRRTAAILRRIRETQEEHDPNDDDGDEDNNSRSNLPSFHSPPARDYKVQTKRARLEEMVSAIKKTGPKSDRSRRHSGGDDDTSSGGQGTSGDEVTDPDAPADLRRLRTDNSAHINASLLAKGLKGYMMAASGGNTPSFYPPGVGASSKKTQQVLSPSNFNNNNNRPNFNKAQNLLDETSANLLGGKQKPSSLPDLPFPGMDPSAAAAALGGLLPKNFQPLSPSDASKIYGVDPETYQQQMMQLQLTSAAMLGDPGGLLKAMGSYPPWVYLGYYSQLLHSFQAQEILRQYAIQSQSPTVGQGETSPSAPRILSSSAYNNCGSPPSPASVSESPAGIDSDGSVVGQGTLCGSSGGGNGSNAGGKRAPRAMTGRHVRTGTGASPTTLQTLRLKIEERQRMKAQQLRHDMMLQSHASHNNSSKGKSKYAKKFKK